jgi:hypothetical protein
MEPKTSSRHLAVSPFLAINSVKNVNELAPDKQAELTKALGELNLMNTFKGRVD